MTHIANGNVPIYNQYTPENIKVFDRKKISLIDHLHRMPLGIKIGDIIYSTFGYYNSISRIDVEKCKIDFLELNVEEPYYGDSMHLVAYVDDEKMIFLPHRSPNLVLYDRKEKTGKEYFYGDTQLINYNKVLFNGNYLFLFPVFRKDIGVFDLKKNIVSHCDIGLERNSHNYDEGKMFAVVSTFINKNKAFMLASNPNCVIEFDSDDRRIVYHDELFDCMSMCYDGLNYWIGKLDKCIVKTDFHSKKVFSHDDLPYEFEISNTLPLSGALCIGKFVLFTSYRTNVILRVDTRVDEFSILSLPTALDENDVYNIVGYDKEKMYLFSPRQNVLIVSDVMLNTYRVKNVEWSEECKRMMSENEKCLSDMVIDLKCFINHIKLKWGMKSTALKKVGRNIYDKVYYL